MTRTSPSPPVQIAVFEHLDDADQALKPRHRSYGNGRPREVKPGEGPDEVDPGSHPKEVEKPQHTPVEPGRPQPAPTPTSPPRAPQPDAPTPGPGRPPRAMIATVPVVLATALQEEPSAGFSWEAAKATLLETLTGIWVSSVSHLPFLIAGASVLAATALAAFLLRRVAAQFLKRSRLRRSRAEVVRAIERSLEKAQVEIPFPQRVFSCKTPETPEARENALSEAV